MDLRLRELERLAQQGDPTKIAAYLHALIHAGQYSIETTKILAWLRYPPALILHPHIRGKRDYLTKAEGRSVLLAAVERIFFPPYFNPRQGPPATPEAQHALRTVTSNFIENAHIHINPGMAELLANIHLDIFQHRAVEILTQPTRTTGLDSPSMDTVNNRISAMCTEVIHSPCSEFFSLSPIDRRELQFGRYLYMTTGAPPSVSTPPMLIQVSKINDELAIGEPGSPYYPTALRNVPADAVFSELRPLKSIIPRLLPPSLRSS